MKLSQEGIEECREILEEELSEAEWQKDKRIKLDRQLLEALIFEVDGDKKKIVWTGDILHHLDLSEVSFEGVSLDCESWVCLAKTNAKFTYGGDIIRNCDLSGSSGITIDFEVTSKIVDSDLSGIDLSKEKMEIHDFMNIFDGVILSNTGIHITCDSFRNLSVEERDTLRTMIDWEYLNNCYINNRIILSKEDRESKKAKMVQAYEEYKMRQVLSLRKKVADYKVNVADYKKEETSEE